MRKPIRADLLRGVDFEHGNPRITAKRGVEIPMKNIERPLIIAVLIALPTLCLAAGAELKVKAFNKLPIARPRQTIELPAKELAPVGGDLTKIHVKDAAGNEVLCQAVDTDYDEFHKPDMVIFQADFAAGETKMFTVFAGAKVNYSKEQFKAHGRFVRERFDDFAWENDRIAHRMYGRALEAWKGEPLTSSTVDIWSKRTPRMVIDEWYMLDDYHKDHGDGADYYSAGTTRGCGGNGLWAADQLWTSRNFVESHVLANGPIRVMFELVYDAFDVNGTKVSEVKRITLDAGSNLDHFQSFYSVPGEVPLTTAIGLKKVKGEKTAINLERGWLVKWEQMEKSAGNQGLAVVVDPKRLEKQTEDQKNLLLLAKVPANKVASYWAGFCWDKGGQFTSFDQWKTYVDQFAQSLASQIEVSVAAQ
jgi:hypothetical protein